MCIFQWKTGHISETVTYGIGYYYSIIGSGICSVTLVGSH